MTTPTVDYAQIVGQFGIMVGDTGDADDNPDFVAATGGVIKITPTIPQVQTNTGAIVTLGTEEIPCTVGANGMLTFNGKPSVWVLDLGSDKITPSIPRDQAAYMVSFSGMKAGAISFDLLTVGINPQAGTPLDLGKVIPPGMTSDGVAITVVPGAPGEGVPTGGTTGQILAKASATDFDTDWVDPGGATAADWNTLLNKPAVIAAGDTAATARTAIGLGSAALASTADFTPAGEGVPAGGTAGQILSKASATSYDLVWINAPSGGTADWNTLTNKPAVIAAGATAAAARTAIGLGTAATSASTDFAAAVAAVPAGGTTGQILAKSANTDYALTWENAPSGGTADWNTLTNKPAVIAAGADAGSARNVIAAAPLASPAFTGTPTAPTPAAGDNTTKISTTAFVAAAIAALVAAAPATLDTLNELATALNDDPNFATTMTNALAGKVPTTRLVNGHALSADVTVTAADVAAMHKLKATADIKTAAYTAAVNDLVRCNTDTIGSFVVTLPSAPADGSLVGVKQFGVEGNNITVTCGGTDHFDEGATTFGIGPQDRCVIFQYDSTLAQWIPFAQYLTVSSLNIPSNLADLGGQVGDGQVIPNAVEFQTFTSANYTTQPRPTARTDIAVIWIGDSTTSSTTMPTNSIAGDPILTKSAA